MKIQQIGAIIKAKIAELTEKYKPLREWAATADFSSYELRRRACETAADAFLHIVSQTGMPTVAADVVGIPYRYWLEFREDNANFASQLNYAIEEGENYLLDEVIQKLPLSSTGARSLRLILAARRPERYQVRTVVQSAAKGAEQIVALKRLMWAVVGKLEGLSDEQREALLTSLDNALEDISKR